MKVPFKREQTAWYPTGPQSNGSSPAHSISSSGETDGTQGGSIRPLKRADLAGVASLFEHVFRSGSRVPAPDLASYFERTLLDYPGRDEAIPPLVYENDRREPVGFLGVHVRHLRCNGQRIRLACAGPLVTEPEAGTGPVGSLLVSRFFRGPQDLSISDGANAAARRLARFAGAQTAYLGSINWTRPLRPAALVNDSVVRRRRPRVAAALGGLCSITDAAALGLAGNKLRPDAPGTVAERLTPAAMVEHLPAVTRGLRCFPDYDEAFLEWALRELEQVSARGRLVRSLVRDSKGRVLGWYLYYLSAGGVCPVVQVAATRRATGAVLDHLFHHAYANGGGAVRGRAEPHLLEELSERHCLLHYYGGSIIHARDPAVLAAAVSTESLLTYLEGEWWMGPHLRLS